MDQKKEMSPHVPRLEVRINRAIDKYIEEEMFDQTTRVIGPSVVTALASVTGKQIAELMPVDALWEGVAEANHKAILDYLKIYRNAKRENESV